MLKIIADDLGLHKSVNDGIIFLLKHGKLDGASIMANGKEFDHAVSLCLESQLSNIGAHLVMVDEKSLSGIELPRNHKIFFFKYIFGLIDLADIEKELKMQIEKIKNSGIKPIFLNGHQHLHLLPRIMDITIKLAQEYHIPYIRIVNEPIDLTGGRFFRQAQLMFLNYLSGFSKNKIKRARLECNDYFIGFINAMKLSQNDIERAKKLSSQYPDKIIELGCHPGYENDDLRAKYNHWVNYNWQKELEILSND